MTFKQLFLISFLLLFSVESSAIDYDKYKKRKKRQQISVLEYAKKAANDWEFEKADKLLKQAKNMVYSPDKIDQLETLISKQRSAKSEKERKARVKKEREYAEQQRKQQRQQARSSSSNSSNRGCSHFVSFSFDGPGSEHSSHIQMNGPSDTYIDGNGSSSVSANSSGGCIGGRYRFTYDNNASWIQVGDPDYRAYSGSFTISSSASHCFVTISDGFGVNVSVSCN